MTSRPTKCTLLFAVVTTLCLTANAQLLHDDFSGTSINTNLWQTSKPFSGSSITESGGNAIIENRGRLITLANYPGPNSISGAFSITGANSDEFKVVIRTDGTFVNDQFGESANGFIVRFRSSSFFASDEVSIQEIGGTAFSGWTGTLNLNTKYQFKILDDGNNISVFLGSMTAPKVALTSSDSFGNKFVFYNREQIGSIMHETKLDYVQTNYTWSTTTTGFAWLNAGNWTGNPGHYPGVDANSSSIADGASSDIAAFSSMAFSATILGINFSPSSNKGVSNNTGANGSLTLGAIDYLSTTNKSISIGDNSGSAGTLTLKGVTLNGVANTVLANEGSKSLTLQPQIGGGTQDMTVALGNASTNVIQVNGSGGIIISAAIQNGSGVAGSLTKIGTGKLTLSNASTYTGGTSLKKGTLLVNNTTGSATGTGSVQVNLGTLSGTGKINGAVTVGNGSNSGAILLAGNSSTSPGILTINNPLTFQSHSTYKCVLNRTQAKASKISAFGVTINSNVSFTFVDTGTGTLTTGVVFRVIDNISGLPVSGRFNNLPDGLVFASNGNNFKVNYAGGTGNDLTLEVVP
jgi:autotransporter-associated beta strand protein